MKYSIIIVTYKAVDALRRCLDSINASGIEDAEIVVYDNSPVPLFVAPPDRPWSPRVPFFAYSNGMNFGFAEGCNRAAKLARGEVLIFLNPDTQVFGAWADQLAGHLGAKYGESTVGMVGPISNFVAGSQQAERWQGKDLTGKCVATKLLIGFCFAIPTKVWQEVGGMDPDLFLGCDDLDLSLRVREAGYTLAIAPEVFVHHDGHQSFYQNPDTERLVKETIETYRAKLAVKYGGADSVPSATELWGGEIIYTGPYKRQTLAVNLIVRDEEDNLRELLPQLGFADEVVVVDTKPDRPADVQEQMATVIAAWCAEVAPCLVGKIKVRLFPWVDDFAAARNHALSHTASDYVLWLDADDRVPEESRALLRAAMDNPGPLTAQKKAHFALLLRDKGAGGHVMEVMQPRVFPRVPELRWEQPIHENYTDRAMALGLTLVTVDNIVVEHHGYADPVLNRKKQERNVRILRTLPPSPHSHLHLGTSYMVLGDHEAARDEFHSLLLLADTWSGGLAPELVAHVRYMLAATYYRDFMTALDAWQRGGHVGERPAFPLECMVYVVDNPKPDALFLLAESYYFLGRYGRAAELYEQYAGHRYTDYFGTQQDNFRVAALGRLAMIEARDVSGT